MGEREADGVSPQPWSKGRSLVGDKIQGLLALEERWRRGESVEL